MYTLYIRQIVKLFIHSDQRFKILITIYFLSSCIKNIRFTWVMFFALEILKTKKVGYNSVLFESFWTEKGWSLFTLDMDFIYRVTLGYLRPVPIDRLTLYRGGL